MVRWLLREAWEKINIPHAYREIKALGKKHGRRFFWAALIWEMVEDIVFPILSWLFGVPELIPVFLILHFEPIVYPVFFWGFRMWDRYQGREPWYPERSAHSFYWRSVLKVLVFQMVVLGWLSHFIPWKPLTVFAILISLFSFVHERIWHDNNWGILPDDSVTFKRTLSKVGTYLLVTSIVMFPLLRVFGVFPIWRTELNAQILTGVLYLVLERVWAKSLWGIVPTAPIHNN